MLHFRKVEMQLVHSGLERKLVLKVAHARVLIDSLVQRPEHAPIVFGEDASTFNQRSPSQVRPSLSMYFGPVRPARMRISSPSGGASRTAVTPGASTVRARPRRGRGGRTVPPARP